MSGGITGWRCGRTCSAARFSCANGAKSGQRVASGRTRILIRELLSMLLPELHDPSTEEGIGRGLRRLSCATRTGRHIPDVAGTGWGRALRPRPEAAMLGRSNCAE
jgi:hypothetical protein